MPNTLRILTMGDSVTWGQGLLATEKLDYRVQQALMPGVPGGVSLESLAHSGAVIGANGAIGSPQPGEVPEARLSVIEQSDGYANSPRRSISSSSTGALTTWVWQRSSIQRH